MRRKARNICSPPASVSRWDQAELSFIPHHLEDQHVKNRLPHQDIYGRTLLRTQQAGTREEPIRDVSGRASDAAGNALHCPNLFLEDGPSDCTDCQLLPTTSTRNVRNLAASYGDDVILPDGASPIKMAQLSISGDGLQRPTKAIVFEQLHICRFEFKP